MSPIIKGGFRGQTIEAVVNSLCRSFGIKLEHLIWRNILWIKGPRSVCSDIRRADANLTRHERCKFLSLCWRDFLFFSPTDSPAAKGGAVRILANVRLCAFFFAADAALLMYRKSKTSFRIAAVHGCDSRPKLS